MLKYVKFLRYIRENLHSFSFSFSFSFISLTIKNKKVMRKIINFSLLVMSFVSVLNCSREHFEMNLQKSENGKKESTSKFSNEDRRNYFSKEAIINY